MTPNLAKQELPKMRFHALDLMRFCAALSVVLYHYIAHFEESTFPFLSQITKFGYLGVPLFFMISGFVITASAEHRSPITFLISRATRLYPAYWLGVGFTSLVLVSVGFDKLSLIDVMANLTMLNSYFGVANIDGIYWTLHAELKFYGCVFLLMAFGGFKYYRVWLTIWAITAVNHSIFQQPFFMGWFISPAYSSLFISGVAFYLLWREGPTRYLLTILTISSVLSCVIAYKQANGFMHNPTVTDSLLASFFTGLFHIIFGLLAINRLSLKPKRFYIALGGITYPLYLFHNTAGKVILDHLYPTFGNPGFLILTTTVAMIALAYTVHKYFEKSGSAALRWTLEILVKHVVSILKGAKNSFSRAKPKDSG